MDNAALCRLCRKVVPASDLWPYKYSHEAICKQCVPSFTVVCKACKKEKSVHSFNQLHGKLRKNCATCQSVARREPHRRVPHFLRNLA